ncbi:phage portal protein [Ferrimonas senticii]|uniref:phage portal protein n=1 Tax=Ferrimonas senticii TaxID=394566 RepID=UPI00040AB557|nr:phage portal protein [Ferrimonas senticii]
MEPVLTQASDNPVMAFSFGHAEPLLKDSWLTDMAGVNLDLEFNHYVPPIDRKLLYQAANTNAYLGPVLMARRNMVLNAIITNGQLSRGALGPCIHNYLWFGDMALLKLRNNIGQVAAVAPLSSYYLRRRPDGGFNYLQEDSDGVITVKRYRADDVAFLGQYDPLQQLYGVPDYIGGLQSAMLNSDATMFKRRYYKNGAHMGYILYTSDPKLSEDDKSKIEQALAGSKGAGNFRNMFINIPDGQEKGIQVIPIGDFSSKDQFASAKNITAQDVLTANRFPAGMAGIIPQGAASLGDALKTDAVYQQNEVQPLAHDLVEFINSDPDLARLGRLSVKPLVTEA